VREIVCGADFWVQLGAIAAPFPLFMILAVSLRRLGRVARG
jgi:hypothetical protein